MKVSLLLWCLKLVSLFALFPRTVMGIKEASISKGRREEVKEIFAHHFRSGNVGQVPARKTESMHLRHLEVPPLYPYIPPEATDAPSASPSANKIPPLPPKKQKTNDPSVSPSTSPSAFTPKGGARDITNEESSTKNFTWRGKLLILPIFSL